MKKGYIKKESRKTILFLADDMRLPSGIGTMTKELIVGNAHRYNFVHVGGAVGHPETGKILDMSEDINKEVGITDASVLIYPYNGYGDQDLIRMLMAKYKIEAIVHFTDPRYWEFLYRMSAEIRQQAPICYYHIWDDLPAPHYNRPYYESCDLLMGISKQSYNISKLVLGEGNWIDLDEKKDVTKDQSLPKVSYVPHGINEKYFYPIDRSDIGVVEMRRKLFGNTNPKFVLFYNNRNIRRKMTSDAILAFKLFHDSLPAAEAEGVRFVLHTQSADEHGTDLPAVIDAICPDIADKIIITNTRLSTEELNILYSSCDAVINIASNEGWGLSSTEAMMTGRVLINNVTGGLQDQCRFVDHATGKWLDFNDDFGSNHSGKHKAHGKWVYPVFPAAINLQGSLQTPYIFDDRCDVRDVAKAIMYWYSTDAERRKECGLAGRKWATSDEASFTAEKMAAKFSASIDTLLASWTPPKRFKLYDTQKEINRFKNKKSGINL